MTYYVVQWGLNHLYFQVKFKIKSEIILQLLVAHAEWESMCCMTNALNCLHACLFEFGGK